MKPSIVVERDRLGWKAVVGQAHERAFVPVRERSTSTVLEPGGTSIPCSQPHVKTTRV